MTMTRVFFAIPALMFLLFAAHGLAAAPGATMDPTPDEMGERAFSLPDLEGNARALSDYRGKFVLVNFWATWCPPCVKEMPSLQRAHEHFKGEKIEVVAIHVGPAGDEMQDFLSRVPVTFTILVDEQLSLQEWGVIGLPTSYLVDPSGRVIYGARGEREWDAPHMFDFFERVMAGEDA